MFCSACGSEISLVAEVCPSCGRAVAATNTRTLTRIGAASMADAGARSSGSWMRSRERMEAFTGPTTLPPLTSASTESTASAGSTGAAASIFAGDLDVPGFPRDLPSRIALLTALVMEADLLLPWVNVNGASYAPTQVGLPAVALLVALLSVIAPPLLPRWRRAPLTRMLPLGVGALMLGFAGALWAFSGPLAPALMATLAAHVPFAPPQVAPALGLYVFLLGAGALLVTGYLVLAAQSER
jgi:hypothetical protein